MSEVIRPEMQELANALVHARDTADLNNAQLLAAIVRHFDTRALERAGGNRRNAVTRAKLCTKPIITDKQVPAVPPFGKAVIAECSASMLRATTARAI